MLMTHGGLKAKRFEWSFHKGHIRIENENHRLEEYSTEELFAILKWLADRFGPDWFPLANNVEKLGKGEEIDGLGVAILRQQPRNISHAQGSSYLGVVLEHVGILEWNNRAKGIKWRIIRQPRTLDELRRIINMEGAQWPTGDLAASLAEAARGSLTICSSTDQLRYKLRELWNPEPPASLAVGDVMFSIGPSNNGVELTCWSFGFTPTFWKSVTCLDKKLQGRILVALSEMAGAPLAARGDTVKPSQRPTQGSLALPHRRIPYRL